jgi:asparagine synthase (glutamine-hydrolysing)
MCGFVGVVRAPGRRVEERELAPLVELLRRRGPDGTGIVVDRELGIASTRLAIQGGREGDQPLRSRDGRFVLAYNGELFSSHRRALRGSLRAEGAGEVRVSSDTELLLAWLAHRLVDRRPGSAVPASAFEPLRGGMYAFALADLALREVVLHSDGGVKPLYVMASPERGETWFASTMGPLHRAIAGPRRLDVDELAWRVVCPSPRRPLARGPAEIEEVVGRTLLLGSGTAGRVTALWPRLEVGGTGGPGPAIDEVREAYAESAREAGELEGPVTVFLSGGLDSAGVAAWCGRRDALALTGRFLPAGGPFDEAEDARAVASAHGLTHEVVDIADRDLLLDLPAVVEALEEPLGGPGSLPLYRLAARARAHGRVALSGTGGDERFGGYVRLALALGRAGPWTAGYEGLAARLEACGADPRRRWLAAVDRGGDLIPWLDPDFSAALPTASARAEVFLTLFGAGPAPTPETAARALVTAELGTTLRMLLHVEDRVTMAHSLESRPVPCLGRAPEVAARLADLWLVGPDGEPKRALRAALEGRIPEAVRANRRKRGFPTPFHRAATGEGRDLAEGILSSARFRERGWWDVGACRRLLDTVRPDHDRALFTILSLETWARRFLDGPSLEAAAATRERPA